MLNSFEPPPARVFAWRQLRLMREQGLSKKQAQRAVQAREDSGQRCATPHVLLRSLQAQRHCRVRCACREYHCTSGAPGLTLLRIHA